MIMKPQLRLHMQKWDIGGALEFMRGITKSTDYTKDFKQIIFEEVIH